MTLTYIIYFIVLFFSTIFCIINGYSKNKLSKYLSIFFGFLVIILFSSLRGENVGIDNPGYYEWYNFLNIEGSLSDIIVFNLSTFEPGYVILNYIFKTFSFSYNQTLIIYSILIWFPIFLYNEFYKKNFWVLIYIILTSGYLFFSFNGIRQAIALGFIFLAVYFLKDQNFKKFFLFILIASFFHFSSLLIISFYLIYIVRKQATILWLLAIIFSLIIPSSIFFNIFSTIIERIPFYANYVNYENFMQSKTIGLGVIFQILLSFIILNGYKNVAQSQFQIFLFHITFLGSIMYNIFYGNLFFMRFIVYFTYFTPFSLALILNNWLNNRKYFEFLMIMFLCFLFFVFKIFYNDSGCSPFYFN